MLAPACCDSPAPRGALRGGLVDGHAGRGEERRAVLAVTEATLGVEHARLAQPERQRRAQKNKRMDVRRSQQNIDVNLITQMWSPHEGNVPK